MTNENEGGLTIVQLVAENVKRLRAVDIEPTGNVVVIAGRNSQGKQQPVSEPVLTPDGWSTMGTIRVGDHVIGSDGKPTEVVGVYPQSERRVFEMRMVGGDSTRCGPDHLWTVDCWQDVRRSGRRTAHRRTQTLTTMDLIEQGLMNGDSHKWSIIPVAPVEFADSGEDLPIDPYVLGVILGDGHIEPTGYVTVTSWDAEILDALKVEGAWRSEHEVGTAAWSRPLRHLGLAGKLAHEKSIPLVYLRADIEDRRAILAGLLDTDGTAPASWAHFDSTSESLVDGVIDLASSLGYVCGKRGPNPKRYRYKGELKQGRDAWRVTIRTDESPFRLARKTDAWSPSNLRPDLRRFIHSIEPVADEDSVCIMVAAEDGLYVTNDFILTHNTSVLDSIAWALGGTRLADARPVRDGEDRAMVELDLGDFTVTRTWAADGKSTLKVMSKEGAKYPSPQTFLDERLGQLSFDPLAFSGKPDKEQVADLLALVDLPFDPDELARQRLAIFDERTDVNRELRRMEASLGDVPRPEAIPAEVDINELLATHRGAQELMAGRQAALNDLANATTRVDELRDQLAQAVSDQAIAEKVVTLLPPAPDMDDLDERIANAETRNTEAREIRRRHDLYGQIDLQEAEVDALTERLADIDRIKADALENADMPVPGLSFDDEGVTYQGIPFRQCSASERLRVSLGMAIAANPTIKVIRIVDGSLLDSENMAVIEQMAADSGSQVWVEIVSEDSGVGFIIEDGMVRA